MEEIPLGLKGPLILLLTIPIEHSKEEVLDVLNEQGRKTGEKVDRATAHKEGVLHGVAQVLVFKTKDMRHLLVAKSTTIGTRSGKRKLPGGHIKSGESDLEGAYSEYSEEVRGNAKTNIDMKFLGSVRTQSKEGKNQEVQRVHACVIDGDVILQENELVDYKRIDLEAVNNGTTGLHIGSSLTAVIEYIKANDMIQGGRLNIGEPTKGVFLSSSVL